MYIKEINITPKNPLISNAFFCRGVSGHGDSLFLLNVSIEKRKDKILRSIAKCQGEVLVAIFTDAIASDEKKVINTELTTVIVR